MDEVDRNNNNNSKIIIITIKTTITATATAATATTTTKTTTAIIMIMIMIVITITIKITITITVTIAITITIIIVIFNVHKCVTLYTGPRFIINEMIIEGFVAIPKQSKYSGLPSSQTLVLTAFELLRPINLLGLDFISGVGSSISAICGEPLEKKLPFPVPFHLHSTIIIIMRGCQ